MENQEITLESLQTFIEKRVENHPKKKLLFFYKSVLNDPDWGPVCKKLVEQGDAVWAAEKIDPDFDWGLDGKSQS